MSVLETGKGATGTVDVLGSDRRIGGGDDKISDITINIIRERLTTFMTEQCLNHGVPTRRVPEGCSGRRR